MTNAKGEVRRTIFKPAILKVMDAKCKIEASHYILPVEPQPNSRADRNLFVEFIKLKLPEL